MQYPNGITDAQSQKKTLGSPKATPPRRKQCTSTIIAQSKILDFYPEDSPRSQNNAFNKAIARNSKLRSYVGFSP
jgi:hypothetical protein